MMLSPNHWIRHIFILLSALIFTSAVGQDARNSGRLELTLHHYDNNKVLWASLYGDDVNILDTIFSGRPNHFIYEIPYGTPYGIYRIMTEEGEKHLDVVFDGKPVVVATDYHAVLENLKVERSAATRQYHRFMRARGYVRYKQKVANDFLTSFPPDDPFYHQASEKYVALSKEMNDSIDQIAERNTFLGKLLQNEKMAYADSIEGVQQYTAFRKAHFFDNRDYSNAAILRSPLFPEQILDYLSLYRDKGYSKSEQEAAFLQAIDSIMKYTKSHPEVFDYAVNYLIEGFKRFGMDNLVQHIAERTADEIECINRERQQAMEEKLSRIRAVSVGSQAPELTMKDIEGNTVSLYDVDSPYVLLVFWASWCPHCMSMLPELQAFNRKHGDSLKTVAVSLDRQEEKWKAVAGKYDWIHLSSLQGWETPAVDDYFIYGTPSFFLLDSNKTIIKKGATLSGIRSFKE